MIRDETYAVLNDEAQLREKEEIFKRLSLFYGGGHDGRTCNLDGYAFFPQVDPYAQPEKWMYAALDQMAQNVSLMSDKSKLRPLCVEMGFYGVHFVDKILGADVFFQDGNWNAHYLETPVGELAAPDFANNETFLLAERLLNAFLQCGVKLPVFGLPTLASPLNIALNLYGQEFLIALYTDPDAAKRDIRVITDTIASLHRYYRGRLPEAQLQPVVSWQRTQPYGYGQICGCSTQLVSDEIYREFFADADEEILNVYPHGGMIHLCGAHLQHAEIFRGMKSLHALQLHNRAAQDLESYYENLRDDQVIYLNCCEEMPYERAFDITKGRKIIFAESGDPKEIVK